MKGFWRRKRERAVAASAQLRTTNRGVFGAESERLSPGGGEVRVYRRVREALPVIDAAICKLIRLTGGVTVKCGEARAERELGEFLRTVNTGRGQTGLNSFLDAYLDSLLTCGCAVGEILPAADGHDIAALLCGRVDRVTLREGESPLEFAVCAADGSVLPRQELLLFTPFAPEAEHPCGVSLLRSMPSMAALLMQIYDAMGKNWERCGNVRFAVTCRPGEDELDRVSAQERADQIAQAWSHAMRSDGVSDFVSVGDVSIKAIGADNQMLDSEAPVRQILEQLVAKTGLPPFMLGLSWSSTERMSTQQADLLTTEITAIRRSVTPVVERVCRLWLRMHGYGCAFSVEWDDINLQDEVEEARAALYREQARKLKIENDKNERAEETNGDRKGG